MNTQLKVTTAPCPRSTQICYILGFESDSAQWLNAMAQRYNVNLVEITGMDWDNDLTPWPAPGQPAGSAPFKGDAPEFLKRLQSDVIPRTEQRLGLSSPQRTCLGISLSGLFSLWQWMVCDTFSSIISLSGSFWYEGFTDWLNRTPLPPKNVGAKAYFSLGQKEPLAPNKVFRTVGECTAEVVKLLSKRGVDCHFQWEPGTHYAPYEPRIIHGLDFIYGTPR